MNATPTAQTPEPLRSAGNLPEEEHQKALAQIWELNWRLGNLERSARRVIQSARKASKGQDLVLRDHLLDLAREVGEPLHTTI